MDKLDIAKRRLWTPRPEVTMENYQEVFNFYDKFGGPNPGMTRFGHLLFSKIYVPQQIDIRPQDADLIDERLRAGATAFLLMNHATKHDQYNLASFVQLVPALHGMRARTSILTKYVLFNKPGAAGKAQRYAIDAMGSLPVFRAKDLNKEAGYAEKQQQRNASDSSLQLGMNKTDRDRLNAAGYPENERLLEGQDPTIVRRMSRGFGMMYENLGKERETIIITAAHFSGIGDEADYKHPVIAIGPPEVRRLSTAAEFNDVVAVNLQRDLTRASGLWVPSQAA